MSTKLSAKTKLQSPLGLELDFQMQNLYQSSYAHNLRVPPNLNFEIDDAEEEWLYKAASMDFIHCRYLFHGIRDWPKLFDQAMRYSLMIITPFSRPANS